MLGVDPEIGTSALRLWIAAGSAALLVVLCVVAYTRPSPGTTSSMLRSAVIVLGAILGTSTALALFDRPAPRDQGGDRRALELRAQELTMRALAPGSPLACLDALAGESVEAACEKAIFATPASVAIAMSYVAARLALLSDMAAYARRGGGDIDSLLVPLRHSLEADRFGFLAHALTMRDGCTSQNCKALEVLHDASHVRANLSAQTFDGYVEHYLTVWARSPDEPVADSMEGEPNATAELNAPGQRKVMVDIDFPTAASIPPISIMNPEPKGPVVPGVAAGAAANANPATPAASPGRRSRKHAAKPQAQDGAQGAAPSPAAEAAQTDPVWTPAPSPAVPQAAARPAPPSANFAPAGVAPVQLDPFASPPEASPGMTMPPQ